MQEYRKVKKIITSWYPSQNEALCSTQHVDISFEVPGLPLKEMNFNAFSSIIDVCSDTLHQQSGSSILDIPSDILQQQSGKQIIVMNLALQALQKVTIIGILTVKFILGLMQSVLMKLKVTTVMVMMTLIYCKIFRTGQGCSK
jgi:hypothetical protein